MHKSLIVLSASALALAAQSGSASADQAFCTRYAGHALSTASLNQDLPCGHTGPRWSTDRNQHLSWCLGNFQAAGSDATRQVAARDSADAEDAARIAAILECRATLEAAAAAQPAGGGGGAGGGNGTVQTVTEDTDLYDAPSGNRIGDANFFLREDQQVTVIGNCGDDWCQIANPAGWAWGGHMK